LDVTEFVYKFSDLPPEQMKMLKTMYGGDSMRLQMAILDKESVGVASGAKGDPINVLIDPKPLVKEQRVKTALGDLPEKAGLVLLLDPGSAMKFVKSIAEKAAPCNPFTLPTYDKPIVPVANAAMAEKNGLGARSLIRARPDR